MVELVPILESEAFRSATSPLSVVMGVDEGGNVCIEDIGSISHLLIAGSAGTGKSTFIHSLIMSMACKASPDDLKLLLIDPTIVEFAVYRELPHLLVPVVTDPAKATGALDVILTEALRRCHDFSELGVRNLQEYNAIAAHDKAEHGCSDKGNPKKKPSIVVVVDGMTSLLFEKYDDIERIIRRIAQLGNVVGIYLILSTQHMGPKFISAAIMASVPSRVSFRTSRDGSRMILDCAGAEKLCRAGEMLVRLQQDTECRRLQSCYIKIEDIRQIVNRVKRHTTA